VVVGNEGVEIAIAVQVAQRDAVARLAAQYLPAVGEDMARRQRRPGPGVTGRDGELQEQHVHGQLPR